MKHYRKAIFIASALLCFSLSGYAQRITLNMRNVTVKQAMNQLTQSSGYAFVFSSKDIDPNKHVSVFATNSDVNAIVRQILRGQNRVNYKIKGKSIILSRNDMRTRIVPTQLSSVQIQSTTQTQHLVTGQVVDTKGEPVIGASVKIKGTNQGTITNVNGRFSLEADRGRVLVISYIGYNEQEVKITSSSSLHITLKEHLKSLDELVVVGYGVQKRSDLISAISTVKGSDLAEQPVPRVDDLLRGKVAGMQVVQASGTPGSSTSIRIRGGNSLAASNEPLYVIDGFIDAGDLNSLNPNDIESIEVLKDATSTAIYGARGSNGVILITTKRGKAGKAVLDMEASYGWQKLPRKLDLLSPVEYAEYLNKVAKINNTAIPYDNPQNIQGVDWQDELFRTAPVYNLNVSSRGGAEKMKYLVSVNHFSQDGILINTGFKRTIFRTSIDSDIKPWLSLGTTINLSHEYYNQSTLPTGYDMAVYGIGMSPIGKAVNDDGTYNYTESSRPIGRNPLSEALLPTSEKNVYALLTNSYIQLKFNKHLVWKSTFGLKWNYSKDDFFQPKKGTYLEQLNSAKVATSQMVDILTEHTLNYNLTKGVHSFTLLGGFTAQKGHTTGFSATVSNLVNDLTGFNDLNSAQTKNSVGSGYQNWGYMSFLGRANYSFDNRYYLTAVVRYDGSSRFAKGNKWAFFPSVSVGWRISEEKFMKNQRLFDDLKLRMSYGRVGNQAIDIYSTQSFFSSGSTILGGTEVVTYRPNDIPNPNLTWEKTNQIDVGLDFSLFKSRLTGSLDYYHKKTIDLLWQISVPSFIGQSTQMQNLGSLKNDGFELALNGIILDKKDWKLSANFNIATNKSKVLSLGPDQFKYVGEHWGGYYSSILKVGSPVGLFYGQVYDGVLTQADIDANHLTARPGDAKFKEIKDDPNNSTVIGNANPDFYGGFGFNVAYKGVSLNAFCSYSVGNDVLNLNSAYFLPGNAKVNAYRDLALNIWTPEKPTNVARPANSYTYAVDSRFVENGSFLRLSSLTLSYDFPVSILKYIGLSAAKIYVTGNNLFNICHYRGYDPEVSLYSESPILKGYDWGQYPMSRSFSIGIKFTL